MSVRVFMCVHARTCVMMCVRGCANLPAPQIESSLQVKQFLVDTRSFLAQMLRIVNVTEDVLVTLSFISGAKQTSPPCTLSR